jgi:hypothetical protein
MNGKESGKRRWLVNASDEWEITWIERRLVNTSDEWERYWKEKMISK